MKKIERTMMRRKLTDCKNKKGCLTDKRFVIADDRVIGVYYQGKVNKLTIGGNKTFIDTILYIVEDYFKILTYELKIIHPVENKVKAVFSCREMKYLRGIKKLHDDGIIMQTTKNLNRIWW